MNTAQPALPAVPPAPRPPPTAVPAQRPLIPVSTAGAAGPLTSPSTTAQLQGQGERAFKVVWAPGEQRELEAALARYPEAKHPPLERYLRIAASLQHKGARDVALRIKWMVRQAAQKRQRAAVEAAQEDRRQTGRARGQSIFAVPPRPAPTLGAAPPAAAADRLPATVMPHPPLYQQTSGAPQHHFLGGGAAAAAAASVEGAAPAAPTMMLDDHGSGTVGGIGGPIGRLLDTNQSILLQFKDNMRMYKVQENTTLLKEFRDNIISILGRMDAMGGVMREMPVLPVALNAELARNFLGEPGASSAMGGIGCIYQGSEDFPVYPTMPAMSGGLMGGGDGSAHNDLFPDMGMQPEGALADMATSLELGPHQSSSPPVAGRDVKPDPSQGATSDTPPRSSPLAGLAAEPAAGGPPSASAPAFGPPLALYPSASRQLPMPAAAQLRPVSSAAPAALSSRNVAAVHSAAPADSELPAGSMSDMATLLGDASVKCDTHPGGLSNDGPAVLSAPTSGPQYTASLPGLGDAADGHQHVKSASLTPTSPFGRAPGVVRPPLPNGSAASMTLVPQIGQGTPAAPKPFATRSVPALVKIEPAQVGSEPAPVISAPVLLNRVPVQTNSAPTLLGSVPAPVESKPVPVKSELVPVKSESVPFNSTGVPARSMAAGSDAITGVCPAGEVLAGPLGKRPSATRTTPSPMSKKLASTSAVRPVDH